ncbi:MAG: hypothetical protein AAGJ70_02650 [Pseudomonadota bacterium]
MIFAMLVLPIIALLLPDYRTLAIFSICVGAPLALYLFTLAHQISVTPDPDWMVIDQIFIQALAFYVGLSVLAKAVFIFLKSRDFSFLVRSAIVCVLMASPFMCLWGESVLSEWHRRPPSIACLNTQHQVLIGEVQYTVPLMPGANLYTQPLSLNGAYYLGIAKFARAFCKATRVGTVPLRATKLQFTISERQGLDRYCETDHGCKSVVNLRSVCRKFDPVSDKSTTAVALPS